MAKEWFEVMNKETGKFQFAVEVDFPEDIHAAVKLGIAALAGRKDGFSLAGVDLDGVWMQYADLREVRMAGASFVGAHLAGSDFRGADLRGVSFFGADVRGCNFRDADLSGVDFGDANMGGWMYFDGAILEGSNLLYAGVRDGPTYAHIRGGDIWVKSNRKYFNATG